MKVVMKSMMNSLRTGSCLNCWQLIGFCFRFYDSFSSLVLQSRRFLDIIIAETNPTPRTISKLQLKQSQLTPDYIINQTIRIRSMLDEDDSFYKTLPFTLPVEQSNPSFVIFGTGLQECLLAAHFSKVQGKSGLVLDFEKTYGSCLKTVTIKELFALENNKAKINLYRFLEPNADIKKRNEDFEKYVLENKMHRGYSIDLEPNFFFGSSITCEMLKEADMDKYMDFRLVNKMLHFDGKAFNNVPLSKGKIFQSKDLSLLEKKLLLNTFHSLTQIFHKYSNYSEDQNSTKQFDKEFGQVDQKLYEQFMSQRQQNFTSFLEKLTKNNKKIINYIVYIIANYQHNYKQEIPEFRKDQYKLSELIVRFGKFIKSCGVYGECPYLYVDNGIGDVPQAYSRIASLYLSTYILHPCIEINSIDGFKEPIVESEQSQTNSTSAKPDQRLEIVTNLVPGGHILTPHIYYGPTSYHLKFNSSEFYHSQYTLRLILLCKKLGTEEECPTIVYLLDLQEGQNPVYLFMLDSVSHSCPDGFVVYQFETVLNVEQSKNEKIINEKVQNFKQLLVKVRGVDFENSIIYSTAYIREKRYPKADSGTNNQTFLKDHTGIDLDSHFINFKNIVGEQPSYFKKQGQEGHNQDEEWGGQDQTTGLINRLEAIDIHNEKSNQENQSVQKANEEPEATPQNEQNIEKNIEEVNKTENYKQNDAGLSSTNDPQNKQESQQFVKQNLPSQSEPQPQKCTPQQHEQQSQTKQEVSQNKQEQNQNETKQEPANQQQTPN